MERKIQNYLLTLNNPYTNKNITVKELQLIKYIKDVEKAIVEIVELGDEEKINTQLQREIIKYLKINLAIKYVKFSFVPSKEENEKNNSKDLNSPKKESLISSSTKIIAIISGKGGVGKSQVTSEIAKELIRQGKKVGIMDCDIYGYSIPKIFNHYETPKVKDGKIIPPKNKDGIEMISSQYFIENNENKALIWRGPMLVQLMEHFVYDVQWDQDLEYIVIDMPPGTGDVMLNMNALFPTLYSYLVTTPSENASHVAIRAGDVAKSMNFNVQGVIENMSWYEVDGKKHLIFGHGGGQKVANELEVDLIEQIPLSEDRSEVEKYFASIAQTIIKDIN